MTLEKKIIKSTNAPAAIGPYSQAVVGNGTLYVSGQLPIDPATGVMSDSLQEQVAQSMKNVFALVEAAGGTAENIVKCGDRQRCVDVVIKALGEGFLEGRGTCFVIFTLVLDGGDICDQLAEGVGGIVKCFPGEYKRLAVMRLQAEETVNKRIIALFLEQRNGEEFTRGFTHFALVGV